MLLLLTIWLTINYFVIVGNRSVGYYKAFKTENDHYNTPTKKVRLQRILKAIGFSMTTTLIEVLLIPAMLFKKLLG